MLGAFLLFWAMKQIGLPYGIAALRHGGPHGGLWRAARPGGDPAQPRARLRVGGSGHARGRDHLQNAVRLGFGATPLDVARPAGSTVFEIGGVLFFGQRMLVCAAFTRGVLRPVCISALSEIGRAMRAMAQNAKPA